MTVLQTKLQRMKISNSAVVDSFLFITAPFFVWSVLSRMCIYLEFASSTVYANEYVSEQIKKLHNSVIVLIITNTTTLNVGVSLLGRAK